MKKILFFILFTRISIVSLGQNTQYFNKLLFPFSGTNHIDACVKIDSNYYLFGGNLDTPFYYAGVQAFELIKLSQNGSIIDKKMWLDSSYNYCYGNFYPGCMIATQSKKLIAWGGILDSNGVSFGLLICINQYLDTLWTKVFTHPDTLSALQPGAEVFYTFTVVRETPDHGFIIAGNYNPYCVSGNIRSFLLKTDSVGNFQWIKKYNNLTDVYNIEITSDSGFVYTDFQNGFHLNKTDKNGNPIWRKKPNSETHLVSGAVTINNDGSFIILAPYVYYHINPNFYIYGINVIKYDAVGTLIWDKKYKPFASFECFTLHQGFSIEATSNNIIIMGTTVIDGNHGGLIMKLNSNGDSLWARSYSIGSNVDECQFNDMIPTDDGGFLAVGFHYDYHPGIMYEDAWIVKVDSFGCDTPGCQSVGFKSAALSGVEGLKVYPNPANYEILIYNQDNSFLPEGVLKLYNQEGKLIEELEVPKGQQSINIKVEHLASGLYFGRINNEKGNSWSFKFVKE